MRAGFTLVEVMVAMIVGALAIATAYSGLSQMRELYRSASLSSDRVVRVAASRALIDLWLHNAVTRQAGRAAFRGLDSTALGMSDDRIEFIAAEAAPYTQGPAQVRLFIDRDPQSAESGMVAVIQSTDSREEWKVELFPEVAGLDAYYLVATGTREWTPAIATTLRLPAAVQLRFFVDSLKTYEPTVLLPLLVDLR